MIIHKPSLSTGIRVLSLATLFLATGFEREAAGADLSKFREIEPQYIAALAPPSANSGNTAQSWGIWTLDPGPRGHRLERFDQLKASGGITQAQWKFDPADWWLEEHGLIMEKPTFPLPPGRYLVTGGREATAVLTIHSKDRSGNVRWELSDGATIYDVTHLGCRAGRYTPSAANNSCSPATVNAASFPLTPAKSMPNNTGCKMQEYAVLIIVGLPK